MDFEAQGATRGGIFTGHPDSPMTIGMATFTGGEILRGESSVSPDASAVYATTSLGFLSYSDPIRISFAGPISGLSLLLTNTNGNTFTVAADKGASETLAVGWGGSAAFALDGSGFHRCEAIAEGQRRGQSTESARRTQ